MYLVDTSVWIDAQQPQPRSKGRFLRELAAQGAVFGLTPLVLQEILQGVRDQTQFRKTLERFASQRYYHPIDPLQTYIDAASLYANCRWRGLTPRSSADCTIACIAIEHGLTLLQADTDFEKIAKIEPRLKLA
jgi:hypothetical protein